LTFCLPVGVPNKVATVIVDHDTLVECMVLEHAILPSLLFSLYIMGEKADKIEDSS
jgi:phosphate starvation-inducible membrane PsiE